MADVRARGRRPVLVGGTGQYVWALLEGWSVPAVEPDAEYRHRLQERAEREGAAALHTALAAVDPASAARILPGNVRRVIRALEVYEKTGRPRSRPGRRRGVRSPRSSWGRRWSGRSWTGGLRRGWRRCFGPG